MHALILSLASAALFATPAMAMTADEQYARTKLVEIFTVRTDLQALFKPDGTAIASPRPAGIDNLEDWAKQYGSKEYPTFLGWFAGGKLTPAKRTVASSPRALALRSASFTPVKKPDAVFPFGTLSADSVLVIDVATRDVLISKNAYRSWPLASITKLMTALVALDHRVPMGRQASILEKDEVGGARLRMDPGTVLTVRQIFDAMLIGSANNAANALARATKIAREDFIEEMNEKAEDLGLHATTFVDPTGIEVGNVSTAEDIAALGLEAFAVPDVRRATTTAQTTIVAARTKHTIKNTNALLTDDGNGLYVLGGKTGYLEESRWNLVVKMKDARNKPLLVVVLGAESQARSFKDAQAAAEWAWANYRWMPSAK
ncbi:MAG TPA: serine hydrolase [Candidatus Eisenbacteria bacterium]|nr:serine hydrolase [Candidatus Eisenbacteria bacterium]